jgi:hypothetical protein
MDDNKDTATAEELLENASKLSEDKDLREEIEEEIREDLPAGHTFYIDDFGMGHFWGPLYITRGKIL